MTDSTHDGRTWVHVTTLLQWNRPPVGIVRVEQEYCRWLLAQEPAQVGEIRFCRFDRTGGDFIEVPGQQVLAQIEAQALPLADMPAPRPAPGRVALRQLIVRLPQPLAQLVHRAAAWRRQRRRPALALVRAFAARLRRPGRELVAPFAPGDRLVSLGLDWDTLDQAALYRIKQRHRLVVTLMCYDLIPVLFPHLVVLPAGNFAAYIVDAAWCADRLVCISECTRRDLETTLRRLGAPQPPTAVVHLGAQVASGAAVAPAGLGDDPRPFVLFVSTIERRKNHELLYRAWVRLRERGLAPHRLVLVGMSGWGVADLLADLRLDPRIQGDILLLDRVTDAELAWLYRHCAFTVFPSLYEGWGLPVAESLACGKFCLASNAASLPEVGGPLIEYLDPWDLPAWVERLAHYMAAPQALAAHEQRIARDYQPPAWADTAATIHRLVLAGAHAETA
jgi:glycosyltransferase involved in cell wall biosynthesis